MNEVITIGVDLAKNVFQVHGVDAEGDVVIGRQLRRSRVLPFFKKLPPCLIGMEACATAHHWARQLIEFGHEVKLMPPHYVKPYVKRGKNDAAGRGGHLRGGDAADHALRIGKGRGAAKRLDASPDAGAAGSPAAPC